MDIIRKALTLKVKENVYTIDTPTAGKLWDIEEAKAFLTNGHYGSVLHNRTFWSEYALDNIDMLSNLTVLCPNLITDMKVSSWRELDPFDLEELKKIYNKDFAPWYMAFTENLKRIQNKVDDEVKE